tara:strand:- start:416 stop:775 length:360 start_codon:yes stop_codon:yes gene_type:complete
MYRKVVETYTKTFKLKLADTEEEKRRGLMYVKQMIDYDGMLFIYDKEGYYSIWMKNTFMKLDILFLDSNFKVVDMYLSATPHSLETIRSKVLCKYIVELKQGLVDKYNIQINSVINFIN